MGDIYKKNKENEFDNGFIYPLFNRLIKFLNIINVVEILKKYICIFFEKRHESHTQLEIKRFSRKVRNYIIDIFIIFKFLFVLLLWQFNINNKFVLGIVIYLLIMNLHTYFYYHIWKDSATLDENLSVNRIKRRFMNLFISFIYMIISYGYLYNIPLNQYFKTNKCVSHINYFIYSISNSFANSYDKIQTVGNIGDIIRLSQVIMTFIFITLILTCSIPKANKK